ncbi:MAG: hypothetical protein K8R21_07650, partial [Leptospira sp.]|nr:hypothetical protein [Leptospira sp.]
MNLSKLIKYPLVLITTSVVILNCTETNSIGFTKKDNNNVQNQSLAYLFVNNIPNFGPLSVCGSSSVTPISNPAVTTGSIRTYYNLANCSPNRVPDFTSSSVTSATRGLTGTSTSSRILSNGNQVGSSGVNGKSNVEVTFILNSSTATLDVISYGDGSGSQFSGPTWR